MEATPDMKTLYPRKVILADDSEWPGTASLTIDEETLVINLDEGASMPDAFNAFNDTEKTAVIKSWVNSLLNANEPIVKEYSGYTRFASISVGGKSLRIMMKKSV